MPAASPQWENEREVDDVRRGTWLPEVSSVIASSRFASGPGSSSGGLPPGGTIVFTSGDWRCSTGEDGDKYGMYSESDSDDWGWSDELHPRHTVANGSVSYTQLPVATSTLLNHHRHGHRHALPASDAIGDCAAIVRPQQALTEVSLYLHTGAA
jgi:hypothetical protein